MIFQRTDMKMTLFCFVLFLYYLKQVDFMSLRICSIIGHRRCQNVVGTSVSHSPKQLVCHFLFLSNFDVFCDHLLNRCMATSNLFVQFEGCNILKDCFKKVRDSLNLQFEDVYSTLDGLWRTGLCNILHLKQWSM